MISFKALFALAKALEGVPMIGVLDGSPASRAGVRYGDVLLSVNGVRTRTPTDYLTGKNLRADGMELVVFRDGVETSLSLTYDAPVEPVDVAEAAALLERIKSGEIAEEPEGES